MGAVRAKFLCEIAEKLREAAGELWALALLVGVISSFICWPRFVSKSLRGGYLVTITR
jgi:hypothetical protein